MTWLQYDVADIESLGCLAPLDIRDASRWAMAATYKVCATPSSCPHLLTVVNAHLTQKITPETKKREEVESLVKHAYLKALAAANATGEDRQVVVLALDANLWPTQ